MVMIQLRQRNPENLNEWIEKELQLDGYIKSNIDIGIKQLRKKFDQVWFIDGGEGDGKSNLATLLAYYVNPEDTRHNLLDRICIDVEEAERVLLSAKPFEAVVIDEGFWGMSATGTSAKLNRLLQRRFTEIRAKNLFVFIVMPSFMDAMRYFAIWRSRCLIHVYTRGDDRGFAAFFNDKKKKRLYIEGKKKFYNYSCVSPNFVFTFSKCYGKKNPRRNLIDEEAYDKKKRDVSLTERSTQKNVRVIMKECWEQVLTRLEIPERPLTHIQKAYLIRVSTKSIERYEREIAENKALELKNRGFETDK